MDNKVEPGYEALSGISGLHFESCFKNRVYEDDSREKDVLFLRVNVEGKPHLLLAPYQLPEHSDDKLEPESVSHVYLFSEDNLPYFPIEKVG